MDLTRFVKCPGWTQILHLIMCLIVIGPDQSILLQMLGSDGGTYLLILPKMSESIDCIIRVF